ncbi:MAG: Mur ligase family protein [Ilumatobacteraceae bacterium]
MLHRSGMLAAICAQARSLGVAGTHGKTTTSSLLMLILAEGGLNPGFVIGGDVADVGTGAAWTGSDWFVVESDERSTTSLPVYGTLLTNIDVDHLENYGTFDAILREFEQYVDQIPGPKVLCRRRALRSGSWPNVQRRVRHLRHGRGRRVPSGRHLRRGGVLDVRRGAARRRTLLGSVHLRCAACTT